jgi:hypothetical protein
MYEERERERERERRDVCARRLWRMTTENESD